MAVICIVAIVPAATTTPTEGRARSGCSPCPSQLKCQQCVGESVADSQSPSAVQFREEIAEQMAQGRTDDEILNFFAERYDQEILLTPPSSGVGVAGLDRSRWSPWPAACVVLAGAYRRRRTERGRPARCPTRTPRVVEACARRASIVSSARLDPDELALLEEERDHLLASIDDLEREHDAGDLDDEDYRVAA